MKIDKKTVVKIADLAKIAISEVEVEPIIEDMDKILTFMDKLNELDTKEVSPLVYLSEEQNVWREDKVNQTINRQQVLQNAAKKNADFFMIPKIIEK